MKNKKMKTMIASLALVGVIGLGSTLAYLSDKSNTLTNTFTVGSGYIPGDNDLAVWIDETKVNAPKDGKEYLGRTLVGNTYDKVLAGGTMTKDPILRVNTGSVKSYVYMKVEGLDALVAKGITTTLDTTNWTKVTTDGHTADTTKTLDGIYRYNTMLDPANSVASTTALFTQLTVSTNFKETDASGADTVLQNVVLKGCAVQGVTFTNGTETIIPLEKADAPQFN